MADVVALHAQDAPPHDLDAEQSVLSALLLAPDKYDDVVSYVGAYAFYADANKQIFEAIATLRESGRQVDTVTVAQELKAMGRLAQVGGTPYLGQIQDECPTVLHVVEHARIVREKWRLRRAREEAQRIAATIRTTVMRPEQVQEFLEANESIFAELAHEHSERHLIPIREVLADTYQILKATSEEGAALTGYPTLFTALDRAMSGLHPGDLYVIAGRPGMGKTAFGMNIIENLATQDYASGVFSLEMPAGQLVTRVLSVHSRIVLARFRAPSSLKNEWTKLINAMAVIDKFPIWIDDTAGITIPEIAARVRKLKSDIRQGRTQIQNKGLVAVMVDYMQLVSVRAHTVHNREQEVAYVSRELKLLAKREGVAVLGLSQLNRASTQRREGARRPQLEDLRESGAIEQDADAVLFVHRPEVYNADDPEVRGIAEIIIGKQRNGPTGTHRLLFTPELVSFRNLEYDDNDEYDGFQDDMGVT